MRLALALLWLCALPVTGQAGAWPRDAGTWFVASTLGSESAASGRRHFAEVYAEFGATNRVTLATQLRHGPGGWRGYLMARWHPGAGGHGPPFGLSAGLRLQPDGTDRTLLMFAAHLGHGIDTRFGNAWARLDLQVQARPSQLASPVEMSLAGQMGIESAGGLIGMLSVTGKRRNGTSVLELSPAIGHEVGEAHTLVLGLTASPSTPHAHRLQLSLWSRF